MPRDAYWFERYHATVRALPRITPETFDYGLGSTALMRHCETVVRQGLQRQLDEVNTPRVLRRKVARLYRYQGIYIEQFVHWKMKLDPMFPSLEEAVPRSGFVLDLGCGYGLATHWLAHGTDQRTSSAWITIPTKFASPNVQHRTTHAFALRFGTFWTGIIRHVTPCCCWTCCTTGPRRSSS